MTHTETEQRLAAAEQQLSDLRTTVAELRVLVGVLMQQAAPGTGGAARAVDGRTPRRGEGRPRLRLIPAQDSISGQEMDEGLRRVRAARGGGR
ncbi:hypothetical protein ACFUZA_00240 [Streptomyces cellulosae]|uniref:hypothetical protein n=1 Tax=Streptomyces cellulosae TaxID=1968 RepID=UPI00369DBDF2